jgi:plastocyanin
MAKLRIAPFLLAFGLLLAACGGSSGNSTASNSTATTTASGGSSSSTAVATGATVELKDLKFHPDTVSIAVGDVVTWTWKENVLHNVTAKDGSFKSPNQSDGTFKHTFAKAGSYAYECTLHSGMTGTVEVK